MREYKAYFYIIVAQYTFCDIFIAKQLDKQKPPKYGGPNHSVIFKNRLWN